MTEHGQVRILTFDERAKLVIVERKPRSSLRIQAKRFEA